jgi:hypothetical protein
VITHFPYVPQPSSVNAIIHLRFGSKALSLTHSLYSSLLFSIRNFFVESKLLFVYENFSYLYKCSSFVLPSPCVDLSAPGDITDAKRE